MSVEVHSVEVEDALSIAFSTIVSEVAVALSWPRVRYDVGDVWRVTVTLVDGDGDPVDPTGFTVEFVSPLRVREVAAVDSSGPGVFLASATLTEPGDWYVVAELVGDYVATETGRVTALPLPLGA